MQGISQRPCSLHLKTEHTMLLREVVPQLGIFDNQLPICDRPRVNNQMLDAELLPTGGPEAGIHPPHTSRVPEASACVRALTVGYVT
jgi:hypothetical protein